MTRFLSRSVAGPVRNPVAPTVLTATLKAYVTSTAAWSTTQRSLAIAYWALFGRSPDRAPLAYWAGLVGVGASVAVCVNTLRGAVGSALILDADPGVSVSLVYHHLLGRDPDEDPSGQAYWVGQLNGGLSYGNFVQTLVEAAQPAVGFHADTFRHRLLTLESVVRLQAAHGVDLSTADSRSATLRVIGTLASYDAAMVDVQRLLVAKVASVPMTWGQVLTADTLRSNARVYTGSSVPQYRNLVWYNREGNMMLAVAYLPSNFLSTAQHRGIVALHGGGLRQGYPEVIHAYCKALAAGTNPSYVVLAPVYRLTAYGHTAPAAENDLVDFYTLAYSAPRFKLFPGKIGLFGESSGGHLSCLTGAKLDIARVFALYPPIDFTGEPSVSAGLDPFCDYYTNSEAALKLTASANLQWATGRQTRFQLWHGLSDGLVPSTQTGLMVTRAGPMCVARYLAGEGHGFTPTGRAAVLAAAIRFFDDRQALDV